MTTIAKMCPFCEGSCEVTSYQPCNDYVNNSVYSWSAACACSECGARSKGITKQYKSQSEAIDAAIQLWNMRPEAKPTLFAIVTSVTNGYDRDAEYISTHFKLGDKVEVSDYEIGGWHTDVFIDGYKRPFNSVHFDFVDADNTPVDIFK